MKFLKTAYSYALYRTQIAEVPLIFPVKLSLLPNEYRNTLNNHTVHPSLKKPSLEKKLNYNQKKLLPILPFFILPPSLLHSLP